MTGHVLYRRREFITLVGGAAAWPLVARANRALRSPGSASWAIRASLEANLLGPFREGLRELGYQEGRNLAIEFRWADGKYERFPALIAELIALNVDVIVTAGTPASLAVKKATSSIPLVMVAVGDPVATGLVASLARPGGNITGLTSIATEMEGKRLELLKEVVPGISHVAVLWNAISPIQVIEEREVQAAAQTLRVKVLSLGVRSTEEIEDAFAAIIRERPGGLLVLADVSSCTTVRVSWTSQSGTACRGSMHTGNWWRRAA